MSRLTGDVTSVAPVRAGSAPGGPDGTGGPAYGVVIDHAVYPLEGQPPLAVSKGWGIVPGTPLGGP